MELVAEATRVGFLVLGIGVNLNVPREAFPAEFRDAATSLRSHRGRPVDRVSFTRRLYENLEPILDTCAREGFAGVLPRFESRFHMSGRRVRVLELDGGVRAGSVLGIDADGALRLQPDDGGAEQRVVAGDVTLEKGPA